jgi:hypothetical protein
MIKITHAEPLKGCRVRLCFDDGTKGIVDLSHLAGKGVFGAWSDESQFSDVSIGDTGDLRWASGVDLCPDSLYIEVTGKSPEDLFPTLARVAAHA